MKNKISLCFTLILILSVVNTGHSGPPNSEPPKEFLNLEVCGFHLLQSCTLKEFYDNALESDVQKSWEQDGNKWLLRYNKFDKATQTRKEFVFVFEREISEENNMLKGKVFARIHRIVYNRKEASFLYNEIVMPMINDAAKKVGRAYDENFEKSAADFYGGKAAPEKKATKPGDFSGIYIDGSAKAELKMEAEGKYSLSFKGKCISRDINQSGLNPIEGQTSNLVFSENPNGIGHIAMFSSGKCKLQAAVYELNGTKQISFREENPDDCCGGVLEITLKKQ